MTPENSLVLGIDTSNYTTSVAVCNREGQVLANFKKLLPVPEGGRGLRQSDALFHHTVQLPELMNTLREDVLQGRTLAAVGYSARPRDGADSYMPCFLAGRAAAHTAAAVCDVPLFSFSHQSGHVMAALYSAGKTELASRPFLAFHVSGGTTDVLLVRPGVETPFSIERVGGTLDLNAGQVIDRAGVMMGLSFPAGPMLEQLAAPFWESAKMGKSTVKGLFCNLSGLENQARAQYEKTKNAGHTAAFVLKTVLYTLEEMTRELLHVYPGLPIIYAGGVMSCTYIRDALSRYGAFAKPAFSADNAAGTALLALQSWTRLQDHVSEK